jgi:hyperosmotically inducible protein
MTFALTTSHAQTRTPLSDAQIKDMIEDNLSEEDALQDVMVAVQAQTVTLTGSVPNAWAKEKAIEEARKVEGVQSLISDLIIPRAESDVVMGQQVADEILRYTLYTMFDNVDIGVDQGTVILVGQVTQPHKAVEIARRASRVPGAQGVRNEIEVLPASATDDRLRERIASEIYGHELFRRYTNLVNPPIHVILKNGRVTLTGVAASNIEKAIAERIARQTFGVLSVENKLQLPSRE